VYSHKALSREQKPEFKHCVALLDDALMQLRWSQPQILKGKPYGASRAYDKLPAYTAGVASLSWSHDGSMLICGTYNGFVVLDAAGGGSCWHTASPASILTDKQQLLHKA
jgi:hypothetical protein